MCAHTHTHTQIYRSTFAHAIQIKSRYYRPERQHLDNIQSRTIYLPDEDETRREGPKFRKNFNLCLGMPPQRHCRAKAIRARKNKVFRVKSSPTGPGCLQQIATAVKTFLRCGFALITQVIPVRNIEWDMAPIKESQSELTTDSLPYIECILNSFKANDEPK